MIREVLLSEAERQLERAKTWEAHSWGAFAFGVVATIVVWGTALGPVVPAAFTVVTLWCLRRQRACLDEVARCKDAIHRTAARGILRRTS